MVELAIRKASPLEKNGGMIWKASDRRTQQMMQGNIGNIDSIRNPGFIILKPGTFPANGIAATRLFLDDGRRIAPRALTFTVQEPLNRPVHGFTPLQHDHVA